nr:leucine-rich repeat protein [Tanacetum cinerariifolium]
TQLQSFQDSSFIGNKLCGPPLNLTCRAVEASDGGEKGKGGSDGPDWGLIASVLIGFVVGFWVIVAPLISSKLWRTKCKKVAVTDTRTVVLVAVNCDTRLGELVNENAVKKRLGED